MLTKADLKLIKSLQLKKYRKQEQCFLVEGAKSVTELLASDFEVVKLIGTAEFLSGIASVTDVKITEVSAKELDGLGEFQTNNTALAITKMKPNQPLHVQSNEFAIALDNIRDPGNLGTIIRTADWYGIQKIIVSNETADFYNPKVISSTMGSFTRIRIYYTELKEYFANFSGKVYGAFLDGKNVHETQFQQEGLILIGNESHGISDELKPFITDKITIPRYGHAESLNAAIATAIICDNVRRSSQP